MISTYIKPQKQVLTGPPEEKGLQSTIVVSIVFHALLVGAFTVRAFLFPSNPINLERTIRVDIVGLPDKVKPATLPLEPVAKPETVKPVEPPKPVAAEPTKPKPVAPVKPETPKVNLEKNRQEQQAALKRLEAIEKLKKMASSEKAKNEATDHSAPAAKPVSAPIRGNEISKGSALKGIARLEHENYTEALLDHVTRQWNLPQWMANANLTATVQVFIDAQGNLLKKSLIKPSGNQVFDDRVMRAIEASAPLPRPPSDLAGLVAVEGVTLEFTPER